MAIGYVGHVLSVVVLVPSVVWWQLHSSGRTPHRRTAVPLPRVVLPCL